MKREWCYANHALSSIVLELIICAFSTYSVGSLVVHTVYYRGNDTTTWFIVMMAANIMMMTLTAFECIWAAWMVMRFCATKGMGREGSDDMNALICVDCETCVPITCISSWLIWAVFCIRRRRRIAR